MIGAADAGWLACVSCIGWSAWRGYGRWPDRPNPRVIGVLWATVAPGAWMLTLELLGLSWSGWLLAAPAGAALLLGLFWRRARAVARRSTAAWVALGCLIAGSMAAVVAVDPTTSWDFRYIWGLKARVFALAGGNDPRWLAWPPNGLHHPDYPPLWPDLLAGGIRLGGSVGGGATVWSVVLLLGLAAACWDILRDASPPARVAGAAIGALAPTIVASVYRGNAELLVAFLAATAVGALRRLRRGGATGPAWVLTSVVAVMGLCLGKNEGMVFALGVVVAAWLFADRLAAIALLVAFVATVGAWQLFLFFNGIGREPRLLALSACLLTGRQMVGWLCRQPWNPVGGLLLTWLLALVALGLRKSAAVVTVAVVWLGGVLAAYLTVSDPILWCLATSFDRVIAAPLPGVVSAALASALDTVPAGTVAGP
ncbi:MAG: hypothetical protein LAO05_05120 [Acidobacteriia bacterium]|nr:hypothetical protein [Terriglobia bacterium]